MEKKVFFIVAVFALASLVFFFSDYSATGSYVSLRTQYITCRYLDFDNHGRCMRVEKQAGVHCNPSETIYPYEKAYGWPNSDSFGWFMRKCQPPEATDKF